MSTRATFGVLHPCFTGRMTRCSIGRIRAVEPTRGSDCEAAFAVHFAEDDQPDPQITVDYARGGGGQFASQQHVRSVVATDLDGGNVLRRIVVDRNREPHPRG
jgi:hypothetical protein